MHFREKKTPYYWTELFYVFLHLCVWHTGLQWHNWLVLMSILSCWFFLYRWFLIGKCNLFSFVLKKNTNQWQMWKNYLKKAKNDWKGLFIDVLFVKKKKSLQVVCLLLHPVTGISQWSVMTHISLLIFSLEILCWIWNSVFWRTLRDSI